MDREADKPATPSIWLAVIPSTLAFAACAAPWMWARQPAFAFALQRGFSLVCHQHADRSFFLFGGSVAVCARCLGIYIGAAAGLLVRLPRQVAKQLFFYAVALNAIDWLAEFFGVHGNWMALRFGFGFALGMAAMMLVAASIIPTEIPVANTSPIGNGGKA